MHSRAYETWVSVTSTGVICKNYDKTEGEAGFGGNKCNSNKKGGLRPHKTIR